MFVRRCCHCRAGHAVSCLHCKRVCGLKHMVHTWAQHGAINIKRRRCHRSSGRDLISNPTDFSISCAVSGFRSLEKKAGEVCSV